MSYHSSPATNLSLGERWHPREDKVEANDHDTHNPEALSIIGTMEPEQNSKDDTAKVAQGADRAAQDAVGLRVDMRNECKIGSIASFQKESHTSNEPEHGALLMWIAQADGDEEGAGDDANEEDPGFLHPQVRGNVLVDEVADYAT